jgi:hypothetical protein
MKFNRSMGRCLSLLTGPFNRGFLAPDPGRDTPGFAQNAAKVHAIWLFSGSSQMAEEIP